MVTLSIHFRNQRTVRISLVKLGCAPKDRLFQTSLGWHYEDHRHGPFASCPSDPTTIDTTCGSTTENADFITFSKTLVERSVFWTLLSVPESVFLIE